MKKSNKEIAQEVVEKMLSVVKSEGVLPWARPWSNRANTVTVVDGYKTITLPPVAWRRNGKPYRGVNTYLPLGEYITFAECKKEGGSVKKGAKSFPIVKWSFWKKTETDPDTGEEVKKTIPFLKEYRVFRVEDCDGIKQKHNPKPQTITIPITHEEVIDGDGSKNDTAEAVVADYVSRAGNGFYIKREKVSTEAFYSPALDYVSIPMREQFAKETEYYSTLFHELGHSTGHETRLNRFSRENKVAAWGDENYAKEELVAEITAASVLNALDMEEGNTLRNSAAYIKSWSEHISKDPMMYVSAAGKAQAAFDLILGIEAVKEDAEEEATE